MYLVELLLEVVDVHLGLAHLTRRLHLLHQLHNHTDNRHSHDRERRVRVSNQPKHRTQSGMVLKPESDQTAVNRPHDDPIGLILRMPNVSWIYSKCTCVVPSG